MKYFNRRGEFRIGSPLNLTLPTSKIGRFERFFVDRQISIQVSALGSVIRRSINTKPLYEWKLPIYSQDSELYRFWFIWQEEQNRQGLDPSVSFIDLTESITEATPITRTNFDPSRTAVPLTGFLTYFPTFRVILKTPPKVSYQRGLILIDLELIEYA